MQPLSVSIYTVLLVENPLREWNLVNVQANSSSHSQASWGLEGLPARERYSLSTWKFHLEAVRDAASKCVPFQRVRDLDRNSLKLIQTNVRNNTPARCYGIEIRTVTITLHWVNRKVPIWDSISQTVSFDTTTYGCGSATSALRALRIRICISIAKPLQSSHCSRLTRPCRA